MNDKNQLISVIIPVFNEAGNIEMCLERLDDALQGISCELLICYDFDEDNTLPAIEAMPKKPAGLRLVKNEIGRGPANAVRAGIEAAKGDVVITMMADLSDDPIVIPEMVKKIRQKGCSVVSGSRYMKGGQQNGGPKMKGAMSKTAGFVLNQIGLNTKDPTTNFRAFSAEFLKSISIESHMGFEIGLELTVKAFMADRKVCEVPATWEDRSVGASRFKIIKWMPCYLKWFARAIFHSLKRNFLPAIFSFIFAALAAVIVSQTIYSIYSWPNAVYFWDQWELVNFLDKYFQNNLTISDFFSQHNEHRILFLKLFFLADVLFFSGKNWLLQNLIVINQLVMALFLCVLTRNRTGNIFKSIWFYALVFIGMFSGIQSQNLYWPFQVAFLGAQLGLVLAVFCISRMDHPGSNHYLLLFFAILGGCYSSFSLASGLIVFPLIIIMAIHNRIRIKVLLPLFLSVVCVSIIYSRQFRIPVHHSNPFQIFNQLYEIMIYTICFIGSPFQFLLKGNHLVASQITGVVGIFLYLLYLTKYSLDYRRFSPDGVAFVCIATYAFVTALMVASGRVKFGSTQALESRYTSISILFWLSIIYLYYWEIDRSRAGKNWVMSVYLLCLIMFCATLSVAHFELTARFKVDLQKRDFIGKNIRLGLATKNDYKKLHFSESRLMQQLGVLKKHKIGLFAPDYFGGRLNDFKAGSIRVCLQHTEKWREINNFKRYDVSPSTRFDHLIKIIEDIPDLSLIGSYTASGQGRQPGRLTSHPFKAEGHLVLLCVSGHPIDNEISIVNLDKADRISVEDTLDSPKDNWIVCPMALPDSWSDDDRLELTAVDKSGGQNGWFGISEPLTISHDQPGDSPKTKLEDYKNLFGAFTDNKNTTLSNCSISINGNKLKIKSQDRDPYVTLLKTGLMEGVIKILKLKIVSPCDTYFEVFYCTASTNCSEQKYSVRKDIKKGENDLSFILPPVSQGEVRFDPGGAPGEYIMSDISLYQITP